MTPEQAALLHKADESLQAARLLNGQHFHGFSVSRAYYTMYYTAEALLLEKGLSFSKHAGVIAAFGQHFAKTGLLPTEFHRYLIEAQDSRNIGDYDTGPGITKEKAEQQLLRAERFLKLAQEYLGPPLAASSQPKHPSE
jgi:uncharacterized protein (UPF0332 family)